MIPTSDVAPVDLHQVLRTLVLGAVRAPVDALRQCR